MMKKTYQILACILLFFNGAGAVYGGSHLVAFPDGSSLHLPAEFLKHSPFENYFIPGLVLFIALGLFSFFIFAAMLFSLPNAPVLTTIEGIIVTGWILIQLLMVREFSYLQAVFVITGLLMIYLGRKLSAIDIIQNEVNAVRQQLPQLAKL
jgi:hypothetical protein